MTIHVTKEHTIFGVEHVRVEKLSKDAIRLCAWPEWVYAGRHLAGDMGRLKWLGHLPESRALGARRSSPTRR